MDPRGEHDWNFLFRQCELANTKQSPNTAKLGDVTARHWRVRDRTQYGCKLRGQSIVNNQYSRIAGVLVFYFL